MGLCLTFRFTERDCTYREQSALLQLVSGGSLHLALVLPEDQAGTVPPLAVIAGSLCPENRAGDARPAAGLVMRQVGALAVGVPALLLSPDRYQFATEDARARLGLDIGAAAAQAFPEETLLRAARDDPDDPTLVAYRLESPVEDGKVEGYACERPVYLPGNLTVRVSGQAGSDGRRLLYDAALTLAQSIQPRE
jgi:hypothetical protein